jgi:hypothetical protein
LGGNVKVTVKRPVEVNLVLARIQIPIRYDEDREELTKQGFAASPGRPHPTSLQIEIFIDSGRIVTVPSGPAAWRLDTKVVDQGTYEILDSAGVVVARSAKDYVPGWMPGQHYGDYVILDVEDGVVKGWGEEWGGESFASKLEEWINDNAV